MAITNHERVGKALDLLKDGLAAIRRARNEGAARTDVARPGAPFGGRDADTSVLG